MPPLETFCNHRLPREIVFVLDLDLRLVQLYSLGPRLAVKHDICRYVS